jgi:hypothetical protein
MKGKFIIQYRRNNGGYPGTQTALSGHLARHHIISYPFMAVYAVVAMWYCSLHQDVWKEYCKFFSRQMLSLDATIKYFNDLIDKSNIFIDLTAAKNVYVASLRRVCWAESNLFIGPAGAYRTDDPSQCKEKYPLSMDEKQVKKADAVWKKWSTISSARITGEDNQFITFSLEDDEKLADFVSAFLEYINYTQDIHVTRYDDWAAVPYDGVKEVYTFWVALQKNTDGKAEKTFQFRLRDKAANEEEPVVCMISFDQKKYNATGIVKQRSGMGNREKELFREKWC